MIDGVYYDAKGNLLDIIPDESVKRCKICGREHLLTRNDAEDVWLVDIDGELICGKCELKMRRKDEN